ncbi:hypothetical protein [Sporosarcina sp. FA9]|uniref:hypothetical protein n=1 Tax=Sporosarcina sp. FA9 TaxID=3413030 RepID=UPI003F656871
MSKNKRVVGQVSFSKVDRFEKELWEWATKEEHGEFSPFIKRVLVEARERERKYSMIKVVEGKMGIVEYADPVNVNEDKEAAKGFL